MGCLQRIQDYIRSPDIRQQSMLEEQTSIASVGHENGFSVTEDIQLQPLSQQYPRGTLLSVKDADSHTQPCKPLYFVTSTSP